MAGQVRFGKQRYAGDAAGAGELMPVGFAERVLVERPDEGLEQIFQPVDVS